MSKRKETVKPKSAKKKFKFPVKMYPVSLTEREKMVAQLALALFLASKIQEEEKDDKEIQLITEIVTLMMKYIKGHKPGKEMLLEIMTLTILYDALSSFEVFFDSPVGAQIIRALLSKAKKKATPKEQKEFMGILGTFAQEYRTKIDERYADVPDIIKLRKEHKAKLRFLKKMKEKPSAKPKRIAR
jgi:hypothetical protein